MQKFIFIGIGSLVTICLFAMGYDVGQNVCYHRMQVEINKKMELLDNALYANRALNEKYMQEVQRNEMLKLMLSTKKI